jgi:hypothetical protein
MLADSDWLYDVNHPRLKYDDAERDSVTSQHFGLRRAHDTVQSAA